MLTDNPCLQFIEILDEIQVVNCAADNSDNSPAKSHKPCLCLGLIWTSIPLAGMTEYCSRDGAETGNRKVESHAKGNAQNVSSIITFYLHIDASILIVVRHIFKYNYYIVRLNCRLLIYEYISVVLMKQFNMQFVYLLTELSIKILAVLNCKCFNIKRW